MNLFVLETVEVICALLFVRIAQSDGAEHFVFLRNTQ